MATNWSMSPYSYRDFKTLYAGSAFKGDVYYWDSGNQSGTYSFYLWAVDYTRSLYMVWSASGASDQKPATLSTDFPDAIQLLDGPAFS